jgi:hypothetical protein
LDRGRIVLATERGHWGGLSVELGECSWLRCGRIEAAKERILERILVVGGATEMLVIDGSESPTEVRELAEYPSHGGSQGFKSPHLHPTTDDQRKRWSSSSSGPVRVAA